MVDTKRCGPNHLLQLAAINGFARHCGELTALPLTPDF